MEAMVFWEFGGNHYIDNIAHVLGMLQEHSCKGMKRHMLGMVGAIC